MRSRGPGPHRGRWRTNHLYGDTLELESTPAGFTVIKWVRPDQNGGSETVVALRTRQWDLVTRSRRRAPWFSRRRAGRESGHGQGHQLSDLAPGSSGHVAVEPFRVAHRHVGPAADDRRAARARHRRDGADLRAVVPTARCYPRTRATSIHVDALTTWRTTGLWGWTRHADFAAAAVSRNGRAVAIRTVTNSPQETRTAVAMRVFRPG